MSRLIRMPEDVDVPWQLALLLVAVSTPLVYLPYTVGVRLLWGGPLIVAPLLSTELILSAALLTIAGGLAALLATRGLWRTPLFTLFAVAVWPWFYSAYPVGNPGYIAVLFVTVAVVAGIEGAVHAGPTFRYPWRRRAGRFAIAVGVAHLVTGLTLQYWARTTAYFVTTSPLVFPVSLGLVVTGGLPVYLWFTHRLVSPVLAVSVWFLWGVYGLWEMQTALPLGSFSGINWISLQPYPDYALQWTLLLAAILVLAGGEYALRQSISSAGRSSLSG